jgi:hypothetical protein
MEPDSLDVCTQLQVIDIQGVVAIAFEIAAIDGDA